MIRNTPRDSAAGVFLGVLCQIDVSCAGTLTLRWWWFGVGVAIINIDIIDEGQMVCHCFEIWV